MLKQMADSLNLSVLEFTKMMKEEHSIVPPGEEDDGPDDAYDYGPHYSPPKRVANPLIIPAKDCEKPIANLRDQMLNPELGRYGLDETAQTLAHYVVANGDLDSRIAEIKTGLPY
jgi:hypothetical protein